MSDQDKINKPLAIITRTVIGLLTLLFAFGIAGYLTHTAPEIEQTPQDQHLPKIQVIKAAPVAVRLQWSGYGTAIAMDRSDVPSRVNSTVAFIPESLQAGVSVNAGDLLAQLDDSDFLQQQQIAQQNITQIKANLAKLDTEESFLREQKLLDEADVDLAKREWDRVKDLFDRKAGTQQDLDRSHQSYLTRQRALLVTTQQLDQLANRRTELEAQHQAQQASLTRAKLDVQRCQITSPIAGKVQMLDVDQGEIVTPGKRIARIVSLDRIEVALQLPASARNAISVGDRVELCPVGSQDTTWLNTITRIAPQDDPTTRTFTVYVQFDKANEHTRDLAPGRYIQGIVYSHTVEKHWLAPARSIQADQIMIVRDGRVLTLAADINHLIKKQFDQLGLADESWAILGTNLQQGDGIIITPSRLVSDGKQVEPVFVADQSQLDQAGVLP
ncbi:MAG: efflux RND transporter periplasmic adaptor subunit [Phycisphaeraceae bacterium JB051]